MVEIARLLLVIEDEEEKKSIELLSEIMFFYFSRIRMLEMLEN